MKKIISCVLVCVLMLCVVANFGTAGAVEPSSSMTDEELYDYLRNHGPVKTPVDPEALLFHIHASMACRHEAFSEWMADITGEYFFADPLTFLRTVAGDSEETITWVANHLPGIVHSFSSYPYGYAHFPGVISGLELTEEDSETTRNLLQALKDGIEAKWGFTLQQYESWIHADLDDYDLKNMDGSQWESLLIYLWHEEDFPGLFKIQPYTENATAGDWVAGNWFYVVYEMFEENPYSVIQALAKQDAQMRQLVIDDFLKSNLESTGAYTRETFAKLLGSIRLPQSATEGEKAILAELIRRTTEEYGVEVPDTGDAIALTVALLTISAGGILCLTRKKKFA